MSVLPPEGRVDLTICLHPSVGLWVDPTRLTPPEKTAAVAKVGCLERDLFDGDRVRHTLSRDQAENLVGQINDLRHALGWLLIDLDRRWRWPRQAA
jgi:hypothetical protein